MSGFLPRIRLRRARHGAIAIERVRFEEAVMAVPQLQTNVYGPMETVDQCFTLINARMLLAQGKWTRFTGAMAGIYEEARKEVEESLEAAKVRMESRLQRAEKSMMFALNLATMVIGGPLAGALASKVIKLNGIEFADKIEEKVIDLAKDKGKEALKTGSEGLTRYLNGSPSASAFSPPGVTPSRYFSMMHENVGNLQTAIAFQVAKLAARGADVHIEEATKLLKDVLGSDFVAKAPNPVHKSAVKKKFGLSLWLSWAWCRDVKYWDKRKYFHGEELLDFAPVYRALNRLDPAAAAQVEMKGYTLQDGLVETIDMMAFINWATEFSTLRQIYFGKDSLLEDKLFPLMIGEWIKRRFGFIDPADVAVDDD
jgi:hypothetical protein